MSETGLWTRWGLELKAASQDSQGSPTDSCVPLAEYPRPQLVRKQYQSLNGWWEYAIVPAAVGNRKTMETGFHPGVAGSDRQIGAAAVVPEEDPAALHAPQTSSWSADGRILVPFSPETRLSGVGRVLHPGEILRYRRTLEISEIPDGKKLFLHFGAVDERCVVQVNGKFAGSHRGGYTAFTCDITPLIQEGKNILTVDVRDDSDTSFHARGKQKLAPGGMFYQAQSGIWKTVWCEWVPERYIERLRFEADLQREVVDMTVTMGGSGSTVCPADEAVSAGPVPSAESGHQGETAPSVPSTPSVSSAPSAAPGNSTVPGEFLVEFTDAGGQPQSFRFSWNPFTIPVPSPRLWSPEDPYLYRVRVSTDSDSVESYFAMRSISVSGTGRDFEDPSYHGQEVVSSEVRRILLNGQPYFMHGVLDQGYWPESLMTPPADAALEWDIAACKEMGFNMLRKHVKVEAARFYYHCDRLGMLVWQDAVNGGREYNANLVTNLPNILPAVQSLLGDTSEKDMRRLGRQDREGRGEYRGELWEMVEELRFFPCICVWVPFNEGWGQFESVRTAEALKKADPGRLVDAASGWFDRGGGDLYSIHNYFRRLRVPVALAARRAAALTEYGGLSRPVEGLTAENGMKAYRSLPTQEALTDAFTKLVRRDILPQLENGLNAAVYTQLSDIEGEINGLFTYDRSLCKIDRAAVLAVRGEIDQRWKELMQNQLRKAARVL